MGGPDGMSERRAHRTTQIQNSQDTDDVSARISVEETRIVVYDGTDSRIIFGVLPDNTFGLVISKEGEDVIDAFS